MKKFLIFTTLIIHFVFQTNFTNASEFNEFYSLRSELSTVNEAGFFYDIMKEIKLTQGQVALVDDENFEYLNQWKWFAHKGKNTFYAERKIGTNKSKSMHRFILKLNDPKIFSDHIDHNGLNNQEYNLRSCTALQNARNTCSRKNSTSKYLGVSWYTKYKKWHAQIKGNRKIFHIGYYEKEVDAAIAYNKKAIKLHKEFANLNTFLNQENTKKNSNKLAN